MPKIAGKIICPHCGSNNTHCLDCAEFEDKSKPTKMCKECVCFGCKKIEVNA